MGLIEPMVSSIDSYVFAFSFSLIAKEPICTWTSADGRTLGIFVQPSESNYGIWGIPIFIN